jgi:hypothetical protein
MINICPGLVIALFHLSSSGLIGRGSLLTSFSAAMPGCDEQSVSPMVIDIQNPQGRFYGHALGQVAETFVLARLPTLENSVRD